MSGHSEFAPIGNRNPPAQMPPVGPVGSNAGQPANVPQGQPENVPVDQQNVRSLVQKLDAMLPKYIDENLYRELTSLRTGERREAYLADLAKRLPSDAVDSARRRLDRSTRASPRSETPVPAQPTISTSSSRTRISTSSSTPGGTGSTTDRSRMPSSTTTCRSWKARR